MTTRRDFLAAMGTGALAPAFADAGFRARSASLAGHASAPARVAPLSGIGIQLYTLRTEMRADPEKTLAHIAQLAYAEVEWWGNWGRTPAQFRAMLDANHLRAPATHVDLSALAPDRLGALLEVATTVGHRTIVVPSLSAENRRTADDYKRVAGALSTAGSVAATAGVRIGFHNHDGEFTMFGDRTALDILIAESDQAVVDIELDCFWACKAGHDPLGLLRRYKDRITMLHLKDSSGAPEHAQRDIGTGVIDWRPILETAVAQRVTSVFVERDDAADVWTSAASARAHLRTLGY